MAKVQQSNKLAKNHRGETIAAQDVTIDDSLLPSASELEKLKEIDPRLIGWIMERAEQEQSARLKWNETQGKIMTIDVSRTHRFNFTALIFAFLLFIFVIGSAVFCISKGLNVEGTIFGGTAIITGIIFFFQIAIKKRNQK